MDIDDKRQGYGEYAASDDTVTDDTASADTASADTVAAEPPPKPLRGGRDAGGELGQSNGGRRIFASLICRFRQ